MNQKTQALLATFHAAKRRVAAVIEMVATTVPAGSETRVHLLTDLSLILTCLDEKKQTFSILHFPSVAECPSDHEFVEKVKLIFENKEELEYGFTEADFDGLDDVFKPNDEQFLQVLLGDKFAPRLKSFDVEGIFL